jgi:hypothetical protein
VVTVFTLSRMVAQRLRELIGARRDVARPAARAGRAVGGVARLRDRVEQAEVRAVQADRERAYGALVPGRTRDRGQPAVVLLAAIALGSAVGDEHRDALLVGVRRLEALAVAGHAAQRAFDGRE